MQDHSLPFGLQAPLVAPLGMHTQFSGGDRDCPALKNCPPKEQAASIVQVPFGDPYKTNFVLEGPSGVISPLQLVQGLHFHEQD